MTAAEQRYPTNPEGSEGSERRATPIVRYAEACRKDIEDPTPANLRAALDATREVYRERHA